MEQKAIIGISMGDPAGIGPEIVVQSLAQEEVWEGCIPVVIGSRKPLEEAARMAGVNLPVVELQRPEYAEKGCIPLIPLPLEHDYRNTALMKENGCAALAYIDHSLALLNQGMLHGLATAPTNKEALHLAGMPCTGITEYLAREAGIKSYSTVIAQGGCYLFQMTTHIPLREAIGQITQGYIYDYVLRVNRDLKSLGCAFPKIGISGLNPHAGDGGILGTEEKTIFAPVIDRLRREEGLSVSFPQPCDSLFNRGLNGEFDAVVFLFHDTANTASKTAARFAPPVVITTGLPYVRTTVAHGTAYDIAYQGKADWKQFFEAIRMAGHICTQKARAKG